MDEIECIFRVYIKCMKVHIPSLTVPDPTTSLDTTIHHIFDKAQQDSKFLQNMYITYVHTSNRCTVCVILCSLCP